MRRMALIVCMVVALVCATRIACYRSPLVLGVVNVLAPTLLSTRALADNLRSRDPVLVRETICALNMRDEFSFAEQVLPYLSSNDDLLWLNAAIYLGRAGRQEAIPYLIKAFRHTVNCCDEEVVAILARLTGQTFEADFAQWHDWWSPQHSTKAFSFDDHLGPRPRLKSAVLGNREEPPVECTMVDYGIYEVPDAGHGGGTDSSSWVVNEQLLNKTTSIPGRTGTCFGFRYVVRTNPASDSPLPLTVVVFQPADATATTNLAEVLSAYSPIPMGATGLAAFAFDEASEVVPGVWRVTLEYRSKALTGMAFTVVNVQ